MAQKGYIGLSAGYPGHPILEPYPIGTVSFGEAVRAGTDRIATMTAEANFNKDMALRNWIASHGGVYIAISESLRPNPHLAHVPERNIVTPAGKELTLHIYYAC